MAMDPPYTDALRELREAKSRIEELVHAERLQIQLRQKMQEERDALAARLKLGSDKDYVVVNGLLGCLVDIGNEVGVAPEEQLNGALEIIDAISEIKEERDALAAHVDRLKEAGKAIRHELAQWSLTERDPETSAAMCQFDHVARETPAISLDRRDALKQAEAIELIVSCGELLNADDILDQVRGLRHKAEARQ